MITIINNTPVRSYIDADAVVYNKQDIYQALDLRRFDIPQPIDPTLTISADEFHSTVMEFLDGECEAIDVWLRDVIDGNNARNFYPLDTPIGGIIDYWERVAKLLTSCTPNKILKTVRQHGIVVESWQEALRHLDFTRACAVSYHASLMMEGESFEEATHSMQWAWTEYRQYFINYPDKIAMPYRKCQIWGVC